MGRSRTGARGGPTSTSSLPERPRRRSPRPSRPRALREAGIAPARALGQHFLTDAGVVGRILAAAAITPDDNVVEVGPGLGVLTARLVGACGHLVAVELDRRLAARLSEQLADRPNVTIVQGDILALRPETLLGAARLPPEAPYRVVGNLPYNIGAAVLRHFLEAEHPPRDLLVMLQREVAQAMTASPGDLSLLGVSVQVYAQPRRLFDVRPRAFYPPPKVTSSVLRLDVRSEPLVPPAEREHFFAVVRAGFSAPRKQLRNALAQGLRRPAADVETLIIAAGVAPTLRPEDLTIDDWLRLSRQVEP